MNATFDRAPRFARERSILTKITRILISGLGPFGIEAELFRLLETILPVSFSDPRMPVVEGRSEVVLVSQDNEECPSSSNSVSFSFPSQTGTPSDAQPIELEVTFANVTEVPAPFRGRVVCSLVDAGRTEPLSLRSGEIVLATSSDGPVWCVSGTASIRRFRSSLPLPRLSLGQGFSDIFNGNCFLSTLFLLNFLREASGTSTYQNAPLRASFIVDDPNLHWPRYGFVDYREIARHAQKSNYHVSFAMIPIDTWFTHQPTAALFLQEARWLSLLVHGNNHAKKELARSYSDTARDALLRQAIFRIEQFEKRAGLRVCRVMVPPHGACSSVMLSGLPGRGFEAACISTGSLLAFNPLLPQARTLGYSPSEVIEGCSVMPRWAWTGSYKNSMLIAAYLGQALILRGHHQDLKDGPEVLDELARFINGFGDVAWGSMTDLCRRNYQWRMDGSNYQLKLFGTTVELKLPDGTKSIVIPSSPNTPSRGWLTRFTDGTMRKIRPDIPLAVPEGIQGLVIERESLDCSAPQSRDAQRTPPSLVLRRLLTEARDRLLLA